MFRSGKYREAETILLRMRLNKRFFPIKAIKDLIYLVRGQYVMLDSDLADIYGYEVKYLNRQVKRNIERFPEDFMFQLSKEELNDLRCQNVTANINSKSRTLPYVFSEQGIYMLATVLKSELAVQQSIVIMRTFKNMRHYITENLSHKKKGVHVILFTENGFGHTEGNESSLYGYGFIRILVVFKIGPLWSYTA